MKTGVDYLGSGWANSVLGKAMSILTEKEIEEYQEIAREIRKDILNMVYRAKAPHIGSSFSIVEMMVALYFRCLSVSPEKVQDENRDIFILSKGHGCPALYATLARRGFFRPQVLERFGINGGTLELHPTRDVKRGIEVSTGSLGHGLSIGAGMALAARRRQSGHRVFCLLSDGETNEGSVWEAAMFSAHHKLDNLISIVDYNKIQALGKTEEILNMEPLAGKWRSFGWQATEIDGHDFGQIISTLEKVPFQKQKPSVIIAHTTKGKGISFMENELLWHYRCPDEEEYMRALEELA